MAINSSANNRTIKPDICILDRTKITGVNSAAVTKNWTNCLAQRHGNCPIIQRPWKMNFQINPQHRTPMMNHRTRQHSTSTNWIIVSTDSTNQVRQTHLFHKECQICLSMVVGAFWNNNTSITFEIIFLAAIRQQLVSTRRAVWF